MPIGVEGDEEQKLLKLILRPLKNNYSVNSFCFEYKECKVFL